MQSEPTMFLRDALGKSPAMMDAYSVISKLASKDVPVLITGETGVGKKIVADAMHKISLRKENPFLIINCDGMCANNQESHFITYEKDGFMDRVQTLRELIEIANEGTLLFDEVTALPVSFQIALLNILRKKAIDPSDIQKQIEINVRIMATASKDVKTSIQDGTFLKDLFLTMNEFTIHLPPLRERRNDIPELADYFLTKSMNKNKKHIRRGFTNEASKILFNYSWPGNIRELENRISHAVIMNERDRVTAKDLDFADLSDREKVADLNLRNAVDKTTAEYILKALKYNKGNITKAALSLGITRPVLYDLMNKLNIREK